jgi:hypothetical protein
MCNRLLTLAVLNSIAWSAGCVSGAMERPPDSIEAVLPASEERVRAAVLEVLTTDNYPIKTGQDEGEIRTGYRREIETPWDRLLVYRFGVNRSRVTATLNSEGLDQTRLIIEVDYEAKSHLWSLWRRSTPALRESAANQLRLVKNTLRLP